MTIYSVWQFSERRCDFVWSSVHLDRSRAEARAASLPFVIRMPGNHLPASADRKDARALGSSLTDFLRLWLGSLRSLVFGF